MSQSTVFGHSRDQQAPAYLNKTASSARVDLTWINVRNDREITVFRL